jgi:membrane associated rhomboid family serine protease
MLTLYFFGPMVEMVWGPRRFLFYYISCGLGALALHMGIEYWQLSEAGQSVIDYQGCMLGASGAIFGVLVAFAYLFPEQRLRMLFPPIEMKAKYYVPLIAGLELFYGVQGFASGVAHFAHLGGAVAGFLLIFYWGGFRWR